MANLVSTDFASEYGEINAMHGAAYYYMKKEGWVPNPNYGDPIPMHVILPLPLPELGLTEGRSLYEMVGTCDTLNVMNRPEEFLDVIGIFCADKKLM
jgi:glucose-6-phosphate isomerase